MDNKDQLEKKVNCDNLLDYVKENKMDLAKLASGPAIMLSSVPAGWTLNNYLNQSIDSGSPGFYLACGLMLAGAATSYASFKNYFSKK